MNNQTVNDYFKHHWAKLIVFVLFTAAVSYTHLDVYKRQILLCWWLCWVLPVRWWPGHSAGFSTPVSYTHLDVYKRQLGWCVEVVYAAATTGQLVNRGFLNGPDFYILLLFILFY